MAATDPVAGRPAWVDDTLFPFTSYFAELDENVVHYIDEGAGPILLMLHGSRSGRSCTARPSPTCETDFAALPPTSPGLACPPPDPATGTRSSITPRCS
jgi:haloalkane dehalogenase